VRSVTIKDSKSKLKLLKGGERGREARLSWRKRDLVEDQSISTKEMLNCHVMIVTILSQNSVSLPNKRTLRQVFVKTLNKLVAAFQI